MIDTHVFISVHRNITPKEFNYNYIDKIQSFFNWVSKESSVAEKHLTFYIGDCNGCDKLASDFIVNYIITENVKNISVVLCRMVYPFDGQNKLLQTNYDFIKILTQFKTHEERDCFMTENTEYDILWVREGEWDSGTAQNFVRRHFHKK
jgi:hypothetical protein